MVRNRVFAKKLRHSPQQPQKTRFMKVLVRNYYGYLASSLTLSEIAIALLKQAGDRTSRNSQPKLVDRIEN